MRCSPLVILVAGLGLLMACYEPVEVDQETHLTLQGCEDTGTTPCDLVADGVSTFSLEVCTAAENRIDELKVEVWTSSGEFLDQSAVEGPRKIKAILTNQPCYSFVMGKKVIRRFDLEAVLATAAKRSLDLSRRPFPGMAVSARRAAVWSARTA